MLQDNNSSIHVLSSKLSDAQYTTNTLIVLLYSYYVIISGQTSYCQDGVSKSTTVNKQSIVSKIHILSKLPNLLISKQQCPLRHFRRYLCVTLRSICQHDWPTLTGWLRRFNISTPASSSQQASTPRHRFVTYSLTCFYKPVVTLFALPASCNRSPTLRNAEETSR